MASVNSKKDWLEWFSEQNVTHALTPKQASSLARIFKATNRHNHDDVDKALEAANAALRGYGTEAIQGAWQDRYYQDIVAVYVNTGDTYNATVLYDVVAGKFQLTTLGDFVESHEGNEEYGIR